LNWSNFAAKKKKKPSIVLVGLYLPQHVKWQPKIFLVDMACKRYWFVSGPAGPPGAPLLLELAVGSPAPPCYPALERVVSGDSSLAVTFLVEWSSPLAGLRLASALEGGLTLND
jgi:hypothetical protein